MGWRGRLLVATAAAVVPGCAATDAGAPAPRLIAIYSPPVRLGGAGQMIFLPAPTPPPGSGEPLSSGPWLFMLDTPDALATVAGKSTLAHLKAVAERLPGREWRSCYRAAADRAETVAERTAALRLLDRAAAAAGLGRLTPAPATICDQIERRDVPIGAIL